MHRFSAVGAQSGQGLGAGGGWTRVGISRIEDLGDAVHGAGLDAIQMSCDPVNGSLAFAERNEQLDGAKTYSITFAEGQEPPVNGFWSLTLYNKDHFFEPNDLNRFSLGTKNQDLKRNGDGSLTLYAGAAPPGKDKESNWIPAPKGPFSLYIRAYWAKEDILDGAWRPPKIEVAQ